VASCLMARLPSKTGSSLVLERLQLPFSNLVEQCLSPQAFVVPLLQLGEMNELCLKPAAVEVQRVIAVEMLVVRDSDVCCRIRYQ